MLRTTSGYTGGTAPDPTYRRMGDHTEAVEVEYDPARVTYGELLELFWASHDPRAQAWSRQYRNAVFTHSEDQHRQALAARGRFPGARTDVERAGPFYPAEDYHQKYLLQQVPELLAELRARYPAGADWHRGTAAARVNGYLGGHGDPAQLARELDLLGLSPTGQERLRAVVGGERR